MSLTRVGGGGDGGVDLTGWWWVPPRTHAQTAAGASRRRLRVLAQCKAEKKKMGPAFLRELEGVVYKYVADSLSNPRAHTPTPPHTSHASPETAHPPLVALLISQSVFTRACLLAAQSSPVPLFLIHLPALPAAGEVESADTLGTAFANPALVGTAGILGGEVEIRWERHSGGGGRPGLWWKGNRLESWTPESGFRT
ncbi:hypothetical protein FA95DRAFT_1566884 [Auriscalpium vulgare]|uniref:Uncharacterized protein n=1 Tax=Auriscalpium vulgare TaxID=40419 RepID=A0ACB8R7W6_9AGAM|nr:hypothetical protein FA95DRAFT_1566884 [Auriscalpium vulgare]